MEITKVGGDLQGSIALLYAALEVPVPAAVEAVSTLSLASLATICERRKLPKFDGWKRNFLLFHREWKDSGRKVICGTIVIRKL